MKVFGSSRSSTTISSNFYAMLSRSLLVSGATSGLPSPCGVNCSYKVNFDVPYFQCTSSIKEILVSTNWGFPVQETGSTNYTPQRNGQYTVYEASWTLLKDEVPVSACRQGNCHPRLEVATLLPLAIASPARNGQVILAQKKLSCGLFRANYTFENTYENGIQRWQAWPNSVKPLYSFGNSMSNVNKLSDRIRIVFCRMMYTCT